MSGGEDREANTGTKRNQPSSFDICRRASKGRRQNGAVSSTIIETP